MTNTRKKGLLIYNQVDYAKNKWFANELVTKASQFGLDLMLVLRENLSLTIEDSQFLATILPEPSPTKNDHSVSSACPELSPTNVSVASFLFTLSPNDVDFVINRTRDSLLATHFEQMGCKVFNNAQVTEACNHKGKTHQLVNAAGIPSVKTLLGNVHYFKPSHLTFSYPVILKSVSGHGGGEVFKIHNEDELMSHLQNLPTEDFVLQELCTNPGIDIRVFTLGKEILAAVKRTSTQSFKSNYSLGGSAVAYTLKTEEEALVKRILSLLNFDLAGIDFILNKEGQFLFNEIEDVVGTRTLYLNYNFDVVALFLEHIAKMIL